MNNPKPIKVKTTREWLVNALRAEGLYVSLEGDKWIFIEKEIPKEFELEATPLTP